MDNNPFADLPTTDPPSPTRSNVQSLDSNLYQDIPPTPPSALAIPSLFSLSLFAKRKADTSTPLLSPQPKSPRATQSVLPDTPASAPAHSNADLAKQLSNIS